ncbi:MAG: transposase [Anaerolineales bacterium]|nr:transposase [Anaerolineales bacterium]
MANEPLQFGAYYHIYNRGNNRENLFVQDRNYPYFMKLYARHILPVAETFAYCLMPNHFHLLIRTRTEEEQVKISSVLKTEPISLKKVRQPSRAFNNMFIAYARAFNKATGRTGVLFETPFHRKQVTSDAYFQRLIVYIHANPQKHGFVKDFRDWKWSSYGVLGSGKTTNLERTAVLDWFGDRETFKVVHEQVIEETDILQFVGDDED